MSGDAPLTIAGLMSCLMKAVPGLRAFPGAAISFVSAALSRPPVTAPAWLTSIPHDAVLSQLLDRAGRFRALLRRRSRWQAMRLGPERRAASPGGMAAAGIQRRAYRACRARSAKLS